MGISLARKPWWWGQTEALVTSWIRTCTGWVSFSRSRLILSVPCLSWARILSLECLKEVTTCSSNQFLPVASVSIIEKMKALITINQQGSNRSRKVNLMIFSEKSWSRFFLGQPKLCWTPTVWTFYGFYSPAFHSETRKVGQIRDGGRETLDGQKIPIAWFENVAYHSS